MIDLSLTCIAFSLLQRFQLYHIIITFIAAKKSFWNWNSERKIGKLAAQFVFYSVIKIHDLWLINDDYSKNILNSRLLLSLQLPQKKNENNEILENDRVTIK